MIINDESNFLLFMEPKLSDKSKVPDEDTWTRLIEHAMKYSIKGLGDSKKDWNTGNAYKGVHTNCDGERSSNANFLLQNGMITNSLAVHYVKWFRRVISDSDWKKLEELKKYYVNIDKTLPMDEVINIKLQEEVEKMVDEQIKTIFNNERE